MKSAVLSQASWYQALPLQERVQTLRRSDSRRGFDPDLAERRLAWWRAPQSPLPGRLFDQRLAFEGLNAGDFLQILGEPIEAVRERTEVAPAWLELISRCFEMPSAGSGDAPPGLAGTALWSLIRPIVERLLEPLPRLISALERQHGPLPFEAGNLREILLGTLPVGRLWTMLGRTLVLELNVSRLRGELAGETPEDRFEAFRARLQHPATALALLREYPVLAQQLADGLSGWMDFHLEILSHLAEDFRLLVEQFSSGEAVERLTAIDSGQGDSHRRGRTVSILEFSSGLKLVYKPRSLSVDCHFQEVLEWINRRGPMDFRTIRILDRGGYGWAEFVTRADCVNQQEAGRFYHRVGGLMAVLCALDAGDMHAENLIAAGDQPVFIDLECLFQSRLYALRDMEGKRLADGDDFVSVFRSGLLPRRVWSNDAHVGVDISGLGARDGDESPDFNLELRAAGRDDCRYDRRSVATSSGGHNRPRIGGVEMNVEEFTGEIVAGFSEAFSLLARLKVEFFAAGGPVTAFAQDEIRILSRDTRTYGIVLEDSYHPDFLCDALERERMLDHLWIDLEVEQRRILCPLIPFERSDLIAGDIPIFHGRPSSRDVWTSGGERLPGIFDRPSLETVLLQAKQIDERHLERHRYAIETALATLRMNATPALPIARRASPPSADRFDSAALLAGARAAARRLADIAYRNEDGICWAGPIHRHGAWSMEILGNQLSDGLAGIALFLALLADVTGDGDDSALARLAVRTLRIGTYHLSPRMLDAVPLGALEGWGGVIYTLAHLGALTGEEGLLREAHDLVAANTPRIRADRLFSLCDGTAGLLSGVLALHQVAPSRETVEAARVCGQHLLRFAERDCGIALWPRQRRGNEPTTGLAYGPAGIALALVRLGRMSGDQRLRRLALEALKGDNILPDDPSWDRGAAGTGLALLRAFQEGRSGDTSAQFDAAMAIARAATPGDLSLAHGQFGVMECLTEAARHGHSAAAGKELRARAMRVVADIRTEGWVCGVPLGAETPGFMEGIAGIGYGLLRLAAPCRVPSVLAFDPPIQGSVASSEGRP